ncbi:MAG: gamma-glutamyltransferase [Acidobacteria bacterium]|nr:gamma-glutamyltransferase [Acidobacteriota bacterium]
MRTKWIGLFWLLLPLYAQTSTWRPVVMGLDGMVVAGHYATAQAGYRMLAQGGNAIDAAAAAALASTVVEPSRAGIGGHSTILIYLAKTGEVKFINGNGWAGQKATPELLKARGGIPLDGPLSPLVPGSVDGLLLAAEKYGRLERQKLLAPSIELAERGFVVSENLHNVFRRNAERLGPFPSTTAMWFPGGEPVRMGDVIVEKDLGQTLRRIASGGREAFYKGPIARRIGEFLQKAGGILEASDLAGFSAGEEEPLHVRYKGYELYMAPPSSYSHVMLEALNIVEGFDLKAMGHNSAAYLHHVTEALKLAFADRDARMADPHFVKSVPIAEILSKEYAARRRALIRPDRALAAPASKTVAKAADGYPDWIEGLTTYVGVVDKDRNMVSITSTISSDFGSALYVDGPGGGFFLNNWMSLFRPEPDNINVVAPRKRPRHGLSPVAVLKDGRPFMVFGTPGGDTIPQAQLQFFLNFAEFGMNVQQAVEQPYVVTSAFVSSRVPYEVGNKLSVSERISPEVRADLQRRGHNLVTHPAMGVGSVKAILIDPAKGVLMGGAAPATDSYAIGW